MRNLFIVFAMALAIVGCSSEQSGVTTALQGVWVSECIQNNPAPGQSFQVVLNFQGNQYARLDRNFTTGDCTAASTDVADTTGTLQVLGADTRPGTAQNAQMVNYTESNVVSFDIFVLNGTQLQFGTASNNEAGRPTVIDPLMFTRQ